MSDSSTARSARRARLLFACGGTYIYGLERVTLRVIEQLKKRGHDVSCTVSGWTDGAFPRELDALGVRYAKVKLGWVFLSKPLWTLDSLVHAPRGLFDQLRALRAARSDLVLHTSVRTLLWIAPFVKPCNVVTVHDYWAPRDMKIARWCDSKVKAYVVVSDDVRRHMIAGGLAAEKVVRIYNPAPFEPTIREVKLIERRAVPTMGIVGQVTERKGHRVVIEAMARVREQHPSLVFKLRIFGSDTTDFARSVKELVAERGLSTFVEWCGYKATQDEIYPEVDFTLVPTLTPDPCPLSAIEPAVYGKPSITSTAGGLAEIVVDGMTGYQVPPNDAAALADRMAKLLLDPALVKRLGQAAHAQALLRFDTDLVMDQYEALIARLTC